MKIFHGTENANIMRPTVLTLGVFDGLHLGHQRIMQTVVDRAKAVGAVATAITFDPHPRAVLHPESAPPLLQTLDQRLANFQVLGLEQAIVIPFTREFAAQPADFFLSDIIRDRLEGQFAEMRIDLIGSTSLHGRALDSGACPYEVRLRVAARSPTQDGASLVGEEVEALYTNGPAGGGGARKYVHEQIGVVSTLIDRERVQSEVTTLEWAPHAETV